MAKAVQAAARLPFQLFTRWIPEFVANLPITVGGAKVTQLLDNSRPIPYGSSRGGGCTLVTISSLFWKSR